MVNDSIDSSTALEATSLSSSSLAQRYRAIQSMVVDYALGVAIIALNPFQSWLLVSLGIVGIIILKMMWDIRRKWHSPGGHHFLALASYLFNLLGALTMGFMALLTLIFIGVAFPVMTRFTLSAALMTVTWIVGAVTNQFFLNGYLRLVSRSGKGEING